MKWVVRKVQDYSEIKGGRGGGGCLVTNVFYDGANTGEAIRADKTWRARNKTRISRG
jgi:hypothetical protein